MLRGKARTVPQTVPPILARTQLPARVLQAIDTHDLAAISGAGITGHYEVRGQQELFLGHILATGQQVHCITRQIPLFPEPLAQHGDGGNAEGAHVNGVTTTHRPPATPATGATPPQLSRAVESAIQRQPKPEALPEELKRPLPDPHPYPLAALGPVLGAAAQRIHDVVRAPLAMCGQSILAAASLAVQTHADVEVDGRREPISLFALTVGESGERKSAVDHWALLPHREFEKRLVDQYEWQMQEYEIASQAFEASRAHVKKTRARDPAALRSALEDLGPPPVAPVEPLLLVSTPTLEGIHKLFAAGNFSAGLFHDDGGEFIGGHTMNADNKLKSACGLSKLWDSGSFDRVRAGDGSRKFYGRRLALHLMIQGVVAEAVLADEVLVKQGLLGRMLLTWPESMIGRRPYVRADLSRDPALLAYHDRMKQLLSREPRTKDRRELDPRVLVLSEEAREAWVDLHDLFDALQAERGSLSGVRPFASKAASQVLRISGVLTLADNPDAGVIGVEAIGRAGELMKHHLGEASRIVGHAAVPEELRRAERLRDWCHAQGITQLHSRAAIKDGPNCVRNLKAFDEAIAILEKTGWARPLPGGAVIDGARRRRAWFIVPKEESQLSRESQGGPDANPSKGRRNGKA